MADLETDKGTGSCDGLFQCVKDNAFNINTLKWDEEILELLGIPMSMLPEAKAFKLCMVMRMPLILAERFRSAVLHGDQQSALFGQTCFQPGEAEEYLWNRVLPFDEHRGRSRYFPTMDW